MRYRPLVAEFIGTFALIFVGVGAIFETTKGDGNAGLVAVALAHGLTIAVMASATGAISGGHLNPAVTLGAVIGGKLPLLQGIGYWFAQCLGAIAAAAAINGLIGSTGVGIPAPGPHFAAANAFFLELILTFFLMFVVYGTAMDSRAPKVAGLFIGLTVTLDILIGGPLTGAAMNPARWLGPALFSPSHLGDAWIYWLGPLAGAALAGLVWRYVLEEPVNPITANEAETARPGRRRR